MSIVTETWRTLKYLRTPENQTLLPVFPVIRPEEIPAGSALIFYGLPGNAATERICVFKYGCPFHPPFHAALMMRDGLFHNVGKFRTDEVLSQEYRSERRIDVIIYKTMTDEDRAAIMQEAELDTSEPRTGLRVTDYGVRTFIHQGFRFIKAGKQAICSENVVKILAQRRIRSSLEDAKETAPFELVSFALQNPELCEIRTHWVGKDYEAKAAQKPLFFV